MHDGNHAGAPLNPGLVFEMVQAHQKSAALKAAIELDIFRAVGEGPGDVASIARHASASERGTRILCDFLVINGVLAKEDGHYRHTPSSAAFLDPRLARVHGVDRAVHERSGTAPGLRQPGRGCAFRPHRPAWRRHR